MLKEFPESPSTIERVCLSGPAYPTDLENLGRRGRGGAVHDAVWKGTTTFLSDAKIQEVSKIGLLSQN